MSPLGHSGGALSAMLGDVRARGTIATVAARTAAGVARERWGYGAAVFQRAAAAAALEAVVAALRDESTTTATALHALLVAEAGGSVTHAVRA